MDHAALRDDQQRADQEVVRRKQIDRERIDDERNAHPHPEATHDRSALMRVKAGTHRNREQPFATAKERLTPSSHAAVETHQPEQPVEHLHRGTERHLPTLLRRQLQFPQDEGVNPGRRQT